MTAVFGLDGGFLREGPAGPVAELDRAGLSGPVLDLRVAEAGSRLASSYLDLRREVFCTEQRLYDGDDRDDLDSVHTTVYLVAVGRDGEVLGGVRVAPHPMARDCEWWTGSRLAVSAGQRWSHRIGASLVRAACARVSSAGALRFDAIVQESTAGWFARLGWEAVGHTALAGSPHVEMRWPIDRIRRLVAATKAPLGSLLDGLKPGGAAWVGDDGAPVPGSGLVATMDAIVPAMVERDPEWAGWCSVLVNVNDLTAMGAVPVALLDSVSGRDAPSVRRVLAGLRAAAAAWGVPVLGGHTQLGVPPALAVTALGRANEPVPAGGGQPGDEVRVSADVTGRWRPGYRGGQWDSTSTRPPADLRALAGWVGRSRPAAAKDVSMAGLVGSLAMLAEASGCGAELDIARVPLPDGAGLADWLTCFPGWAMVTAAPAGAPVPALPPGVASTVCGRLVAGSGVRLVWPDGVMTDAVGAATGLGSAAGATVASG